MIDFVRISAIPNLIFYVFLCLNSIRLRSPCFWEISKFVISKTLTWFAVESFYDDVESFCTLLWPLIVDFGIDLIFIFVEVLYAFMLVLFRYSICQSILLFRLAVVIFVDFENFYFWNFFGYSYFDGFRIEFFGFYSRLRMWILVNWFGFQI